MSRYYLFGFDHNPKGCEEDLIGVYLSFSEATDAMTTAAFTSFIVWKIEDSKLVSSQHFEAREGLALERGNVFSYVRDKGFELIRQVSRILP